MLRGTFLSLLVVIMGSCLIPVQADSGSQAAAFRLLEKIKKSDSVSFYFLSRTGDYSLNAEKFKDSASTKIHRKCAANCPQFMKAVVDHLKQAKSSNCVTGQQDLLVEVGGMASIFYSHSGRMIEFEGRCYFSQRGIGGLVKNSDFIFN